MKFKKYLNFGSKFPKVGVGRKEKPFLGNFRSWKLKNLNFWIKIPIGRRFSNLLYLVNFSARKKKTLFFFSRFFEKRKKIFWENWASQYPLKLFRWKKNTVPLLRAGDVLYFLDFCVFAYVGTRLTYCGGWWVVGGGCWVGRIFSGGILD